MVSVGSLPVQGNSVFDFESQAGVMHVLASIRSSEISPQQKSELRDLVFLYTNGGRDQSVRLSLEQKIAAYHVVAAPKKAPTPAPLPQQPTIGKFRVAPTFATPQQSVTESVSVPVTSVPVFSAAPAWTPHDVPPAVVPEPQSAPEPTPALQPQPAPVVQTTPEPAPMSEMSAPQNSESTVSVADVGQYLNRIREIKALVNEKVGNPVNLVDINNEVGREYMGALLDAMKKLNSGSSAASAMKRLEDSYAAVLTALEEHEKNGGNPNVLPINPEPAQAPESQMSAPTPEPVAAPISEPVIETIVAEEPANPAPVIPAGTPYQPAPPFNPTPEDVLPQPVTSSAWTYHEGDSVKESPAAPVAPQASGFASLADLKKPHTLADLQANASVKAAAINTGDPLFVKEVDDGLDQLLSEWSIFKKSGLFGTGPKGREHPLFKKIAPLHIPLLLAGRFEGANQEIKQSITDYMNGWRYEQGIIYQQGETFEHYLRRVIRHILDLQKG